MKPTVSGADGDADADSTVRGGASDRRDDLLVRPARQADLLSVFRIEKATFSDPWPFSAFERFLGESAFLVAERDGDIVGYVVADTMPNHGRDLGHVKDLAVRERARGAGVGSLLLRRALGELAVQGAVVVKLEVREENEPARNLYSGEGFAPMRRLPRYYSDGEAAIVMVLDVRTWRSGD